MIPKTIHYCWFGMNPPGRLEKKCLKSWKKYCPEYKIVRWSEDNFDISSAPSYVQEAYKNRKWAFVSDYVRLYALTKEGGVYLDTDMELLQPLDSFLLHRSFVGTEDGYHVSMGIIGAEAGDPFFKRFMEEYDARSFYGDDGNIDTTTIVQTMTDACMENGYHSGNVYQEVQELAIYPSEYFYPLSNIDGIMRKTQNTVAIHWFSGSWVPDELRRQGQRSKKKKKIKAAVIKVIGEKSFEQIKRFIKRR